MALPKLSHTRSDMRREGVHDLYPAQATEAKHVASGFLFGVGKTILWSCRDKV